MLVALSVPAGVAGQDLEHEISRSILQQMIDEQISPLRNQLNRLEAELHAHSAGHA